ncbi:receptor-like serine/threonine-protein kinase ALE2 isoform X1 [Jatropha curcas]|uniref:receptor-like serine/threonine-protein kinase ALE2 isoform X1 n=1 Tax=Jatropha curcas TaxID=180498 RepID=UPI0018961C31|nr:receptor-like serine/threonine-protein kinase ALE2 isoform X1 [Jatropha curcas]
MGSVVPAILQLVKLCTIVLVCTVQGSTGQNISPSPATFSEIPPTERLPAPTKSNVPSSISRPNGSVLHPPLASPPAILAPLRQEIRGLVPSYPPSNPVARAPDNTAQPPLIFEGHMPPLSPNVPVVSSPYNTVPPPSTAEGNEQPVPPNASQRNETIAQPSASVPDTAPSKNLPHKSPVVHPSTPETSPVINSSAPEISPIIHPRAPEISPYNTVPPPLTAEGNEQPVPPNASQRNETIAQPSASVPDTAPSKNLPHKSPVVHPSTPETSPVINSSAPEISPIIHPRAPEISPDNHPRNRSFSSAPTPKSIVPAASPPRKLGGSQPSVQPIAPPAIIPPVSPGSVVYHGLTPSPSTDWKKDGIPVAAPPDKATGVLPPLSHSPTKGSFSAVAPSTHQEMRHYNDAPVPSLSSPPKSPLKTEPLSPASSLSIPLHKQHHERTKINSPAPTLSPSSSKHLGPVISPSFVPPSRQTRYAPTPLSPESSASASHYPVHKPVTVDSPAPSPSPTVASGWTKMPIVPPKVSPSGSLSKSPQMPLPPHIQALPPPPPNEDCAATVCMDPYTNTPPGSPCGCVLPMQVGLRLSVALYTFFPLVSELAQEIAAGVFMKQSQVRIMGANAASQQPEKTIVLIDLVPLGERFDNTTAFLTYQRFWHKQVVIKASDFGDYEVLYVRYPGLPPSPPSAPSDISIIDDGPYSGSNARKIKPLGVDVQKRQQKDGLSGGMIAIIALSASVALVLCSAVAWVLLVRHRGRMSQPTRTLQPLPPSIAKPSGTTGSLVGSGISSTSLSFGSSIAPYAGSAKTFNTSDIERATNNFSASRILGEGGFGRVYSGILEDGTKVAVKVLKRDDHQGGREFLAEVEMLSRLHHRNLVKLIGICIEDRARCLVYELMPNGSVESHLHGTDKESAPLDWDARIKIALGAARGLAYLHEDSSPRVIHRDFKSSNILLEHDFTPKVSDFGLARTAMDEENRHISTRVMGTFGYVAPEYAMTGHLLVKSDVYSYGVVLLELLTGRKPVDMSQPPGQENLVAWARPLLTSKDGLETIIDPCLGPDVPFDSVAKVAAIASMCVQPEVSHRPFMGEVVQALKLVCNECDEAKEVGSRSSSRDFSVDMDAAVSAGSGQQPDPFQNQTLVPDYDSEPDIERGLSMTGLFSTSVRYGRQASGSFRRYSSSGPLRTGRGRQLWQRMRSLAGESVSEHRVIFRRWPGSH